MNFLTIQIAGVLAVSWIFLSLWVGKRFNASTGFLSLYLGFSAFRVFLFTDLGDYANESKEWLTVLENDALSSILTLLLFSILAICVPIKEWKLSFKVLCLVNSVMIIGGYFFDKPWGFLFNASMSGCLTVATLPLFLEEKKLWRWIAGSLGIIAIACQGQSQPIACTFILLFISRIKEKDYQRAAVLPILAVFAGFFVAGKDLFYLNGRQMIWRRAFQFINDHGFYYTGTGSGTFQSIGTYLSKGGSIIFIWLHSDWLQIQFEQGLIGFVLIALVVLKALRKSQSTPALFYSLCAYLTWGIANMPMRYPVSAVYGLFLIRWAFDGPNELSFLGTQTQSLRSQDS